MERAQELCRQCDTYSDEFDGGVCVECYQENQDDLARHNFEFDRWESMTDEQRSAAIKKA